MPDQSQPSPPSPDLFRRIFTAIALAPLAWLIFHGGVLAMGVGVLAGLVMAFEVVTIARFSIGSMRGLLLAAAIMAPSLMVFAEAIFSFEFSVNQMVAVLAISGFVLWFYPPNGLCEGSRFSSVYASIVLCSCFSLRPAIYGSSMPLW